MLLDTRKWFLLFVWFKFKVKIDINAFTNVFTLRKEQRIGEW